MTPAERADRAEAQIAREKQHAAQVRHTGGALLGAAALRGGTRLLNQFVPSTQAYTTGINAAVAVGAAVMATQPRQKHMGAWLGTMVAGAIPVIDWGLDQAFATLSKLTNK